MNVMIQSPSNIKELVSYIAKKNREPQYHIGYCGQNEAEMKATLLNEFGDIPVSDAFSVAYKNNQIIGVFGLDVDVNKNTAEAWGPFINLNEKWQMIAHQLRNTLIHKIYINQINFFVHEENKQVQIFLHEIRAKKTGSHHILKISKEDIRTQESEKITLYEPSLRKAFQKLHDTTFPSTYYDAEDILARLNDKNRLLIIKEGETNKLKAYSYIEAMPAFAEGNIEFIAVSPEYRGQGIGTGILKASVKELFKHDKIKEITICVNKQNRKAIGLYQNAGFRIEDDLHSYSIHLKSK